MDKIMIESNYFLLCSCFVSLGFRLIKQSFEVAASLTVIDCNTYMFSGNHAWFWYDFCQLMPISLFCLAAAHSTCQTRPRANELIHIPIHFVWQLLIIALPRDIYLGLRLNFCDRCLHNYFHFNSFIFQDETDGHWALIIAQIGPAFYTIVIIYKVYFYYYLSLWSVWKPTHMLYW